MSEWTEHDGGGCPAHLNRMGDDIEVELRHGAVKKTYPHSVMWRHAGEGRDNSGDIMRWRYTKAPSS